MKKTFVLISLTLSAFLSGHAFSSVVYTLDWNTSPNDRFYTTFNAGGPLGNGVAATNSNTSGANPGPGFIYAPTGVTWQPNTTYTVDFQVYDRSAFSGDNNATWEFGLWDGLPSDDQGAGNYGNIIGPGETLDTDNGLTVAQSQLGIGTQGSARITDAQVPNDLGTGSGVLASTLNNAVVASFTTGSDVSALGDQVVFLRLTGANGSLRGHWDNITVTATAIPEPSSSLLVLGALGILATRRKRLE